MSATTPTAAPTQTAGDAVDLTKVPAHLFNPGGKWKCEVTLDFTGLDLDHWDLWDLAQQALAQATANHTSGVIISELGDYWTLVVIDPPGPFCHPILVHGSVPRPRLELSTPAEQRSRAAREALISSLHRLAVVLRASRPTDVRSG
jgi:hypothetical protein